MPTWAVLAACAAVGLVIYASLAVYARAGAATAIGVLERETQAAVQTGPPEAAFGAAPVDILADTSDVEEAAPAEPVDGFPPSDAMPEPPPEPEPPADDEPPADAPETP